MSNARVSAMTIGPLNPLLSSVGQVLLSPLQAGGTSNTTGATGASAVGTIGDNNQLSPFAQLIADLQQLQQANPTQYAQITSQISTNLQNAAQQAQAQGNPTAASQLNQLATDFSKASSSGQLPNLTDLAQAVQGGRGHHHHHHHGAPSSASSSGDSDGSQASSAVQVSSSGSSQSSGINPYLSTLLGSGNATGGNSTNALGIILNTLQSAGVSG